MSGETEDHVSGWTVDTLAEQGRERLGWIVAFGVFAWLQIMRRLEILNHENERLLQQQKRTVSADTYASDEQRRREDQQRVSTSLKAVEGAVSKSATKEELQHDYRDSRKTDINTTTKVVSVLIAAVLLYFAYVDHRSLTSTHPSPTQTITVHSP